MDSKDLILSRFFEIERWRDAIENGMGKEMSQDLLRAMCEPKNRAALYRAIRDGRYRIEPPHTAFIPKDVPGEFRTVYVNDEADRVILSIANTLFFELTPDLIHHSCRSYRKGVGCGSVVREVARHAAQLTGETIGWKSDLSKYFDSVAIEHIDMAFDILEERFGQSALVDMIRDYYHSDEYLDEKLNEFIEKYPDRTISYPELEKETGVPKHIWKYRKADIIRSYNRNRNNKAPEPSGRVMLPSADDVMAKYGARPELLKTYIGRLLELLAKADSYKNEERTIQELEQRYQSQIEELSVKNKQQEKTIKQLNMTLAQMMLDSQYPDRRKEEGIKENVLEFSTENRKKYRDLLDGFSL